jgi:hypothetical protein
MVMSSKRIFVVSILLTAPIISCDSVSSSAKDVAEAVRKTDRYEIVSTKDLPTQIGLFRLDKQSGEICLFVFSKTAKEETGVTPFEVGCVGSNEK